MKHFIKKILLFGLIFFVIDKTAYFVLVKTSKLQSDKKLEKIISGDMNQELLILGSSRGIGNLIGEQLEQETGRTTYNLSYRGSDITFQAYILTTYLKHNRAPKDLILVIDNPSLLAKRSTLGFRYDRLYPLAHHNSINNKLIDLGKHSIASTIFYTLRLHSKQLKFNEVKTSNDWAIDDYGSQIVYGRSPHFEENRKQVHTTYNEKESTDKIEALTSIQNICKERGVRIHYIFPPNLGIFNTGFLERFKKTISADEQIVIYDRQKPTYTDEAYFYDVSHLNAKGARVFTTEISNYLNNLEE